MLYIINHIVVDPKPSQFRVQLIYRRWFVLKFQREFCLIGNIGTWVDQTTGKSHNHRLPLQSSYTNRISLYLDSIFRRTTGRNPTSLDSRPDLWHYL